MSQTLKLYIPKVLSENKIVLLKGIGTLQMNYRPAEIDMEAGILDAPREEIFFVPTNERKLDPVLIRVVEIIARVDEDEAADLVENFMTDLQGELTLNGFLTFPNIGWIKKDHWGSLFFEPAAEYISINRFFGFNRVKLPEALSPEEQEVIADLKETAAEKTAHDSLVVDGDRNRNWGFIIGVGLLLIMFLGLSFFIKPNQSGNDLSAMTTMASKAENATPIGPPPSVEPLAYAEDEASPQKQQVSQPELTREGEDTMQELGLDTDASYESQDYDETACIVVVGAFREDNNVDRMVTRLAGSEFKSVVIEGPKLTKVGLVFACHDDPENTLAWAKKNIDQEAWLYKMD